MKEQLESKKMTAPKLEVIRFQNEDVIAFSTASGGSNDPAQNGEGNLGD